MDRTGDKTYLDQSKKGSQIVKCDICGQVLNRSYVKAHKRLSHKTGHSASVTVDEANVVDVVVGLYQQASANARKDILGRLTSMSDKAARNQSV